MQARAGRTPKLLLVDDDPAALQLLAGVLEEEHYEVCTSTGGAQALATLGTQEFDAVLLDLMMPEMDGFQFLHHLREHAQWRSLPVFVLSAKELTREGAELLKRETHAFLHKGDHWKHELLARISAAVSRAGGPQQAVHA